MAPQENQVEGQEKTSEICVFREELRELKSLVISLAALVKSGSGNASDSASVSPVVEPPLGALNRAARTILQRKTLAEKWQNKNFRDDPVIRSLVFNVNRYIGAIQKRSNLALMRYDCLFFFYILFILTQRAFFL